LLCTGEAADMDERSRQWQTDRGERGCESVDRPAAMGLPFSRPGFGVATLVKGAEAIDTLRADREIEGEPLAERLPV
jgi:hypothetical protein